MSTANAEFEIFLAGNPVALNVLIFTEYVNATYFISFDIPLRQLHAKGQVNFAVASQKHVSEMGENCWCRWDKTFKPDLVVMSRYGQADGVAILDYFQQCHIPVIYHIDDDLLEIPVSLGTEIQQRHGDSQVIETRRYLLEYCDLIYASTANLANLLQERFPRQTILHGIYAPYMGASIEPIVVTKAQTVIGYMGSKGHQYDLELVVPALERLLEERPELSFETFGTIRMPETLKQFEGRVQSHSVQKAYQEFLSTLAGLRWTIGLAPLVDSPFNRCKAPTKFIEYTACNIPVVASAVSVYTDAMPASAGIFVLNDWYSALNDILDDSDRQNQCLRTAQVYCESNYSPNILELQLLRIFNTVRAMKN